MLSLTRKGAQGFALRRTGVAFASLFAAGVVSVVDSRSAVAETAGAQAAPPAMAPPKPIDTPVTYPEGASGDASVILELTVNEDGTVGNVGRVEGPEPFAT